MFDALPVERVQTLCLEETVDVTAGKSGSGENES